MKKQALTFCSGGKRYEKNSDKYYSYHWSIDSRRVAYSQQLDKKTQQALMDAINDEYKVRALYQKVIDKFGAVRPFSNIIKAEETHIGELKLLFKKYRIEVPKDEWYNKVPAFATQKEACTAGVNAEIDNVKIYDGLLTFVKEKDIVDVFKRLRNASQENHLPVFNDAQEEPDRDKDAEKENS